ncbi:MAG TPA: histone deacetylase [bacterium]|nr:histone deacetylase [bacterium]
MKLIFSPECLTYGRTGHPESPDRVAAIHAALQKERYAFTDPSPCTDEDVLLVHTPGHLERIKTGRFFDWDTPVIPLIYEHALLSAGAAVQAMTSALEGETAFSLMRPPGHHATRDRVMGFCYLNNMAIAVSRYSAENTHARTAILDIDCHHGNGTEEIFTGHRSVLYVSLHQTHLFPGTGLSSHGNIVNFPLPPMTGDRDYLLTLEKACQHIRHFHPALLGVSAGFDTLRSDPLTLFNLSAELYSIIGEKIRELNVPTFCLLEGGYAPDLPRCVLNFIRALDK